MSPADRSRSGRRRRRSAPARGGRPGQSGPRLRTVRETSAGGLVIDGLEHASAAGGPGTSGLRAALIGRTDRRGRLLWSMPKGHVEAGETVEQTAMREVGEETGIAGEVLASLGSIDYWFVSEGRRIHKTVHHFLLRYCAGELCDEDYEVSEVAWVPLGELPRRLAYADERRLAFVAADLLEEMISGPSRAASSPGRGEGRSRGRRVRGGVPAGPRKPRGKSSPT